MDELLGKLGSAGPQGQGSGGLQDLLGGLMGSGGLGSILGGGSGAGSRNGNAGRFGGVLGGGVAALIPTLLPAVLGMLGSRGPGGQPGIHQLVDDMHAGGLGGLVGSWVGTGASLPISAAQVAQVLTPEQLAELSAKSGVPPDQISAGVAAILPHAVSSLTPDGVVPDHAQIQDTTNQLQRALAAFTGNQPGPAG